MGLNESESADFLECWLGELPEYRYYWIHPGISIRHIERSNISDILRRNIGTIYTYFDTCKCLCYLSHYDLGKIYEEMGRTADAAYQYEAFMDAWSEADEGLAEVEDARARLARTNAD